jgi:4-amino-4-deoxy-L-arabinose transferase-like glycosyltransferase
LGPGLPPAVTGGAAGDSPPPTRPRLPDWIWPAVLLACAVPVLFLSLGANSIWDANEAFYVETPKQMVRSGDYVTPTFNALPRLNKPVLSYWIVAALYHLFGVSVTVERAGIALGALGIIVATFLVGRALRSTLTGVLAALFVVSSPRFVMFARRIFIDIYITMFMALALACFVLAERYPQQRRTFLLLMYTAIGFGVLTKGPVALVLPVLACAVWVIVDRRWRDVTRLYLLHGVAIVLVIVTPWYLALFISHGWAPITDFFVGENVGRYVTSMVPGDRPRPFYFYLPVLFGDLFPWAPLLVVPLLTTWRRATSVESVIGDPSIRRFLWCWVMVIVATFSMSATKQDLYIYPVIPAVAVLVADALADDGFARMSRLLRTALAMVGGLTVAAGAAAFYLFRWGYYELPSVGVMTAVLIAGGLAVVAFAAVGRTRRAVMILAMTFVSFNYLLVLRVLPGVERFKPVVPLVQVMVERGAPADRMGFYRLSLPSTVYYADRPVRELMSLEDAAAFYRAEGPAWAIMGQEDYEDLRSVVPDLCVAGRRLQFDAKLDDLINRVQPPDVLLVTNRCDSF